MKGISLIVVLIPWLICVTPKLSDAGWLDLFDTADTLLQEVTVTKGSGGESSLSIKQINQGLKEASQLGVQTAIGQLGQPDGFLGDRDVKIHLPESLQQVERLLSSVGQKQICEQLLISMNRAAEEAVPEVIDIFVAAVSEMSLADVQTILNGPDDAATRFFQEHTTEILKQRVTPYVTQAMARVQVSHYYHVLHDAVQQYDSFGLLTQYMGEAADLDGYVTDKALVGLFVKIAEQEKLIRDDPAARSTDILRQVFGSFN